VAAKLGQKKSKIETTREISLACKLSIRGVPKQNQAPQGSINRNKKELIFAEKRTKFVFSPHCYLVQPGLSKHVTNYEISG
jgi:hypothetical protein